MNLLIYILFFYILINFVLSLFFAIPPLYWLVGFGLIFIYGQYKRYQLRKKLKESMDYANQYHTHTTQDQRRTTSNRHSADIIDVEFTVRDESTY